MKALLFFVDNNAEEIMSLWNKSPISKSHDMVPFTPFVSIEETVDAIRKSGATIIVAGHYLDGKTTGNDVFEELRKERDEQVYISNSGDNAEKLFPKIDNHANRDPYMLFSSIESAKSTGRFIYVGYARNEKDFETHLKDKNYEAALTCLRRIKSRFYLENYVHIVLNNEILQKESIETIYAVLDYFIDQREDLCPEHGYWVHSVSHFYGKLWTPELKRYARSFLKIAIDGANELSDNNCCSRLVHDFFLYSQYNDDPWDFGITAHTIRFHGTLSHYEESRIKRRVFENSNEYRWFQLSFCDTPAFLEWDNDLQMSVLKEEKVRKVFEMIFDHKFHVFENTMGDLYKRQRSRLQKKLGGETHDQAVKNLNRAIVFTEELLSKL